MGNHFNFPVYRIGKICSIDEQISREETEHLANHISSEWKNYFSKFLDQFENLGIKNIEFSEEKIRREEEETIILSFPKFTFDLNGNRIKCRNSLAICSENHNSKIWAKFTCLQQDDKLAYNLPAEKVREFYGLAQEKGLGMIDIIIPEYEEIAKKFKRIKTLNQDYMFKIMASNSNDKYIKKIFDDVREFSIQDMKELVNNDKYLRALAR